MGDIKKLGELQAAYRKTFNSDSGKMVLEDLQSKCYINSTTATQPNPTVICLNEGARAVLVTINNILNMDIEKLKKMQEGGQGEDVG